jgi:hypothetical protein
MNTDKDNGVHAYIQKHRQELQMSVRATYGLLRIFLVAYGGLLAFGYLYSPFAGKVLVQDFSLDIFIAILAMLSLSEIVLRMTEYSCEIYSLSGETGSGACGKNKDTLLIRFAFWIFPFRGFHRGLLVLWFFLALYYLLLSGLGNGSVCPENFPLSFYAVAGAAVFDFISKGLFIFRIPELGGIMTELANTAIRSDGNIPAKFLDAFLKIFQKLSFKKGR